METNIWTLPNSEVWINGKPKLYIRACYHHILTEISGKKFVLIKGTPGIGKTSFLPFLLDAIWTQHPTEPKICMIMLVEGGSPSQFWLCPDGTIELYDLPLHGAPEYYISDSVDLPQAKGTILQLEVASYNENNFRQFQKLCMDEVTGKKYNMNVFDLTELMTIRPDNMTEEEMTKRFYLFGGSARNVLSYCEATINLLVENTVASIFPTWQDDNIAGFQSCCSLISESIGQAANSDLTVRSFFRHEFNGVVDWATTAMKMIAGVIIEDENHNAGLAQLLKSMLGNSAMGVMFESLAHKKFMNSEFDLQIRKLTSQSRSEAEIEAVRVGYPTIIIRDVADIAQLPVERYGLPLYSSFPLVDAIIQPNIMLQMTISPTVHQGAVNRLNDIQNNLKGNRADHKMIFVVPADIVSSFPFQTNLPADVAQYVAVMDDIVNQNTIMTTKQYSNTKRKAREETDAVSEQEPKAKSKRGDVF